MAANKGVLLFAKNNDQIDYVKQAVYLAKRIRKYLELPVSIATDSIDYLKNSFDCNDIDQIIPLEWKENKNFRTFNDGGLWSVRADFKNSERACAYDLSPYDETLVMDTDYIICNSDLKNAFDSEHDFLIYNSAIDLARHRPNYEFKYISESSVEFYWATVFFFRKTETNKAFFDLIKHIEENYHHYRRVYQLSSPMFRNDYAFSIAIHIMNGFSSGDFAKKLPGTKNYVLDKDILWEINDNELTILVEKENYSGEYTAIKTKNTNVHVMNKISLQRLIDTEVQNV